jgi:alkane 1-monooxygenase
VGIPLPLEGETPQYLRVPRLPFLLAYSLPLLHLIGLELRGAWTYLVLLDVFLITPSLDALSKHSTREADLDAPRDRFHDLVLELWVPTQIILFAWTVASILENKPQTYELVGLCISMGAVSGAGGITIAHELMHRRGRTHRALGEVLMSAVAYAHFCIEHVLGHHRFVGTHEDPVTARRGESVYAFIPRAVFTGITSAWRLERKRCERAGIGAFSLRNRRLRYLLTQTALITSLHLLFGPLVTTFFFGQAAMAVLLLELTDYIEHYGLTRTKMDNGRLERVAPHHSWNSNHALTSAYLFHLTRHSDHHMEASRPYDKLRARPEAPALPAGYPTMMLAALFPPLWFRIMNPRADAVEREKTPLPA